jgi:CheY-like chemotaxis protein
MINILIVDDHAMIAKMMSMRLKSVDICSDHAENGQIAIDMALKSNYDGILMDMNMPVLDGHEAVSQLREKDYKGLIIAVTASAMSEDHQLAINSGCNAFISKPIGNDFENRIIQLIEEFKPKLTK